VKITKGDLPAIAKRGRGQDFLEGCLGCGCLLPVIAGAIIGLAAVSLDQLEQRFAQKDPSWTEVKVERWVRREVRPRLASMSDRNEYAITLEEGQARGKMTVNGATYRLTRARARRDGDAIEVTLSTEGGEQSVIARVRNGVLESLGPSRFADAELETWAAGEEGCNGRITALSPGDGPKLRVMFRAPLIRPSATFSPQAGRRATTPVVAPLPACGVGRKATLVAPLPACGERVARSAG